MTTPKSKTTETLPDGLVFLTVQSNGTVKRTEQPIDFDYKAGGCHGWGTNLGSVVLARRNGVYTLVDIGVNHKTIDSMTLETAVQSMLAEEGLPHPEDAVIGDKADLKAKWEAAIRSCRVGGQTITADHPESLENMLVAVANFIDGVAEVGFAEYAYRQYEREVAAGDTNGGRGTPGMAAVLAFALTVTKAVVPSAIIDEAVERTVDLRGPVAREALAPFFGDGGFNPHRIF